MRSSDATGEVSPPEAILVVEDDDVIRFATVHVLKRAGYEVIEADCGEEAFTLTCRHKPAVVLLDVVLPDVSGFEICRRIKAEDELAETFVVLASGKRTNPEHHQQGVEVGADGYMVRPIGNSELLARLALLLRLRNAQAMARREAAEHAADNAKLRAVMNSSSDAIITTDSQFTVQRWNGAAETLYGWTASEAIGRTMGELVPTEYVEAPEGDPRTRLKTDGSWTGVVIQSRKDGSKVHIQAMVNIVTDADGQPAGVVAINRDISQRIAAEARLRQSEQELMLSKRRLLTLFDSVDDVLYVADPETYEILYANPTVQRTWGPDIVGNKCHVALQGRDSPCSFCTNPLIFGDNLGKTHVWELQNEVNQRWYRCVDKAIRWPDGRMVRFEQATDITDLKHMQATLAQSDRLSSMGMLAAGVAHEINNPLTYLLYNLEALAEDYPDTDNAADVRQSLDDALDGAQRIQQIVKGLGAFSRVEKEELVQVDLHKVIDAALAMAMNEIKYRARLTKDFGTIPAVLASEGRLAQVFLNLLINATHAIEEGDASHHVISVRTWSESGRVLVEIRDTGSGIAPEHLDKLFEPFFSTKKIGVGSGLGLPISKSIIEGYEGTIEVASHQGMGTTFVITLPASEDAQPSKESPRDVEGMVSTVGRLLVVDDEEGVRLAVSALVREHEVVLASSGAEAKAILQDDRAFDVVVCDMMMSDVSGMELHQWLASEHPELAGQLVFMTGGAFTPQTRQYLSTVDNTCLEKPFDIHRFKRVVNDMILRSRGGM